MLKLNNIFSIFTAIIFTFVIASCGSQSSSDVSDTQETEDSEEFGEVTEEETSANPLIGEWSYTEDLKGKEVVSTLSFNQDETLKYTMDGEMIFEGTWESIDDEYIRVWSEILNTPEEGVRWRIIKVTQDELYLNWSIQLDNDKFVMNFNRVK